MFREIVVESHGVALRIAEIFAHGASGERREILHRRGLSSRGGDNDRVFHRARISENFHHLRDGRALLPDRAVNANQLAAALIDDGVENDGGLAGLAIADDQFALAATDGNHRVDGLDAGLQRLTHGLAIDDAGSKALYRTALLGHDRALAIERHSERINDAADQRFADRHGHNPAGALDRVAFLDQRVFAEEHGADLIFFEVQRDAGNAVREREHFAGHDFVEAVNARDAVANGDDRANFFDGHRLLIIFDLLADDFCDFVSFDARHSCSCRDSKKNCRAEARSLSDSNSKTFCFELRAQAIELLADRAVVDRGADLHHGAAE